MAIYWWKCDRAGVRHPICRPKCMVFLDSQILSGIYFYHWHLINCNILYIIPILSTEFFAILPYMLKTVAIYWWKCDRAGVRHPICRPKCMVFLDSQILSGIYFYHWHLINCNILYLIPILSTEFFAILPYMLKTGNNEKYGFKWPILGPFFTLIQKITVIFEIICYFLLSFIHLDKIRPNSHEF